MSYFWKALPKRKVQHRWHRTEHHALDTNIRSACGLNYDKNIVHRNRFVRDCKNCLRVIGN